MNIKAFFDEQTFTITYVVWAPDTHDAVIIDPVLNYDPASSTYDLSSVNEVMSYIKAKELSTHLILETHAHADHLSGAQEFKNRLPQAQVVIGDQITQVQKIFSETFNLGADFCTDGSQFDRLVKDGEEINAGSLTLKVLHTPGHTPACSSYLIDDVVFTGDALFMPDFGVARCDFPGGSASQLYHSVKSKLYSLPDETRVFTAHDYQPGGRELRYKSTIGESKKSNIHINENTSEEEFVKFRTERDSTLKAPKLLLPSIEINIDAGRLPAPEQNGVSYIKIPIKERV